jgi:hypothetical protein
VVTPAPAVESFGGDWRRASAGRNLLKEAPAIACALIDARLLRAGTQPLDDRERAELGNLLMSMLVVSVLASVLALVAWVVILVGALRDGRPWWALLIFLLWPLAYLYLFVHAGKRRTLFKLMCTLGLLSPALTGLVGAWRFSGWFRAIIQVRGGHL